MSPATALFAPGQTETFVAIPEQEFTSGLADVTWSIDDTAVATVTADGRLTAVAPGFTWLRARGAAGEAAHPIDVDHASIVEAEGHAWLTSCGSPALTTCSMMMKSAGGPSTFTLRYRIRGRDVVAEFWRDHDRNRSALVGRLDAQDTVQFHDPAPVTPVVSLGAGGCCQQLREFSATLSGASVNAGGFRQVSGSTTLQFAIRPR